MPAARFVSTSSGDVDGVVFAVVDCPPRDIRLSPLNPLLPLLMLALSERVGWATLGVECVAEEKKYDDDVWAGWGAGGVR